MASTKVASAFATGIASGAGFAVGTIVSVGAIAFWLFRGSNRTARTH